MIDVGTSALVHVDLGLGIRLGGGLPLAKQCENGAPLFRDSIQNWAADPEVPAGQRAELGRGCYRSSHLSSRTMGGCMSQQPGDQDRSQVPWGRPPSCRKRTGCSCLLHDTAAAVLLPSRIYRYWAAPGARDEWSHDWLRSAGTANSSDSRLPLLSSFRSVRIRTSIHPLGNEGRNYLPLRHVMVVGTAGPRWTWRSFR